MSPILPGPEAPGPRVVLAPDKWKGSFPARVLCLLFEEGLREVCPGAQTIPIPLADGGDGTAEILSSALGGSRVVARVSGPLGRPVEAAYALLPDGTAVLESAGAVGLTLLAPGERDPSKTTTRGLGELVRDALQRGAGKIWVGLGGTATVDGGIGMAQALGVRVLDQGGREVGPGGGELGRIARIDCSGLDPQLRKTDLVALCDVRNPLTGPEGAAAVFGPQKGATPAQVRDLDRGLANLAAVIRRDIGVEADLVEGAGAAGGLGAAIVALLGGRLASGVETVLDAVGFDTGVRGADWVLTGEGAFDVQSAGGKVVSGVIARARRAGARIAVLCAVASGPAPEGVAVFSGADLGLPPGAVLGPDDVIALARLAAGRFRGAD